MQFEELEVWKRSVRLCADVYKEPSGLRDFGFKDRITRSALSGPSNIAEGYGREPNKGMINFLSHAKGSAGELRTQIHIGMEIGYIHRNVGTSWLSEVVEISKMLHGLMQSKRAV